MSNGLAAVFIDVLVLAGSSLAQTVREQALTAWIASRDQTVLGIGAAGFDVAEIPWSIADYAADRTFFFRMIKAAKSKTGWEKLDYLPNEQLLMPCLHCFQTLLAAFTPEDIPANETISSFTVDFERCQKHGIIKHANGCVLCNRQ